MLTYSPHTRTSLQRDQTYGGGIGGMWQQEPFLPYVMHSSAMCC